MLETSSLSLPSLSPSLPQSISLSFSLSLSLSQALLHVSSAYSQCNKQGLIDEVGYTTPLPPSKLLGLLE